LKVKYLRHLSAPVGMVEIDDAKAATTARGISEENFIVA
jgi:hypothetical protein